MKNLSPLLSAFFLLLAALASAAPSVRQGQMSPNIIVMMADDMGIGDTSAYQDWTGNDDADQIKTPNMERLARRGIRFTDAHAPSSRCTATRYGLLTGRYWLAPDSNTASSGPAGHPSHRTRSPDHRHPPEIQGLPDRHVQKMACRPHLPGRRREPRRIVRAVRSPKGIADGPLNHGFDFSHGTSRSHPTSKDQGWLFGDSLLAANGLLDVDKKNYIFNETGPKNFEMASRFLRDHLENQPSSPFFLYYACHSNHTSHDPCDELDGVPVKGQSHPGGKRSDFIYENDVALGALLKLLEADDPRNPGRPLLDNTVVIFTSDNGTENSSKAATGPCAATRAPSTREATEFPSLPPGPLETSATAMTPIRARRATFPSPTSISSQPSRRLQELPFPNATAPKTAPTFSPLSAATLPPNVLP